MYINTTISTYRYHRREWQKSGRFSGKSLSVRLTVVLLIRSFVVLCLRRQQNCLIRQHGCRSIHVHGHGHPHSAHADTVHSHIFTTLDSLESDNTCWAAGSTAGKFHCTASCKVALITRFLCVRIIYCCNYNAFGLHMPRMGAWYASQAGSTSQTKTTRTYQLYVCESYT